MPTDVGLSLPSALELPYSIKPFDDELNEVLVKVTVACAVRAYKLVEIVITND